MRENPWKWHFPGRITTAWWGTQSQGVFRNVANKVPMIRGCDDEDVIDAEEARARVKWKIGRGPWLNWSTSQLPCARDRELSWPPNLFRCCIFQRGWKYRLPTRIALRATALRSVSLSNRPCGKSLPGKLAVVIVGQLKYTTLNLAAITWHDCDWWLSKASTQETREMYKNSMINACYC